MNSRIILLISIVALCLSSSLSAQTETNGVITYDVIYMKDGRQLKGEIIIFEEADGDITFEDKDGRKYSFTREDYDYFVVDKSFSANLDKPKELLPRKEEGYEFMIGFAPYSISYSPDFVKDDYYRYSSEGYSVVPLNVKAGAGMYLNRRNYIGISADYMVLGEVNTAANVGIRYCYQYDGYKKNTAFYLPIELNYSKLNLDWQFDVADTVFTDGGYSYPDTREVEHSVSSIAVHVGQGVSFIVKDKKSISIELTLFKNFILSEEYLIDDKPAPITDLKLSGFRLALLYNI